MNPRRLVIREIRHRWPSFFSGVLAVALSLGSLIAALGLMDKFDQSTESQLTVMSAATQGMLKEHEDDIRKAMKGLGFNIHIYPANQDLSEIYSKGFGSETMPESYVNTLAESKIVTVNHLLPRLTRMVEWPEQNRSVLLFGVRGEEPIAHRGANQKKALIDPVGDGEIVLGHELHAGKNLKPGDSITFHRRTFSIAKLHPRRGGIDDITVWISLSDAQKMLDAKDRINSILALECNCASIDRLGEVEREIKAILPDTKIVEVESTALARATARNKAKALREREEKEFRQSRTELGRTRGDFLSVLVGLISLLSLAWIAYLTIANVRERQSEIGVLGAIGVGGGKLLAAFLARAVLMGVLGGVLALSVMWLLSKSTDRFILPDLGVSTWMVLGLAAPLLAASAAWLPAFVASRRDPAEIVRHD